MSVKELLQIFLMSAYRLIICAILPLYSSFGLSCTVFWFQTQNASHPQQKVFFAKNFDWFDGSYEFFRNHSDVNRQESRIQSDRPFKWKSKYKSLTLNQRGEGHPLGGINENGVVVEMLVYGKTKYEAADQRPVINEIAWAQYILDSAANVDEALAIMNRPRIQKFEAMLEYMICDLERCAVIQFEDGHANIFDEQNLEFPVLTNWSYTDSVRFTKLHTPFGGARTMEQSQGNHPVERFLRAAVGIQQAEIFSQPISEAFKILDGSKQENLTQWQVVYSQSERNMQIRDKSGRIQILTFGDKKWTKSEP